MAILKGGVGQRLEAWRSKKHDSATTHSVDLGRDGGGELKGSKKLCQPENVHLRLTRQAHKESLSGLLLAVGEGREDLDNLLTESLLEESIHEDARAPCQYDAHGHHIGGNTYRSASSRTT